MTITPRNPIVYKAPRINAQPSSPMAMSATDSGVDRIDSNVFWYFNLKKKLSVASVIAPFIDELASSAGAMNSWYGISAPPGPGTFPTSRPSPKPMLSR